MLDTWTYKREPLVPRLDRRALSSADAEILASGMITMNPEGYNWKEIAIPLRSLKLDASEP